MILYTIMQCDNGEGWKRPVGRIKWKMKK